MYISPVLSISTNSNNKHSRAIVDIILIIEAHTQIYFEGSTLQRRNNGICN